MENKDFQRFLIINNLINETYKEQIKQKELYFNFTLFSDGIIIMDITGYDGAKFQIERNMKFKDIKKKINKFVEISKNPEIDCIICCESLNKPRISCNRCFNPTCQNCYIKMFRKNKGISKCPFCAFSTGKEMDPRSVELKILEMKKIKV